MTTTPNAKQLAAIAAEAAPKLKKFGRRNVRRCLGKLTNVGDGLSAAMALDAYEYEQGEEVTIIVRAVVEDVQFPLLDKDEPNGDLARKHVFRGLDLVVADAETASHVAGLLDGQRERITRAVEALQGIQSLDFAGDGAGGDVVEGDFGDDVEEL